jgi:hypothetical protein
LLEYFLLCNRNVREGCAEPEFYRSRKQKHDRRDAELIARLLVEDTFPELKWVPTLAERDQRQLHCHEPGGTEEAAVMDEGGPRAAGGTVEDDSSLWKEKEKAAEVVIGFVIEAGNG